MLSIEYKCVILNKVVSKQEPSLFRGGSPSGKGLCLCSTVFDVIQRCRRTAPKGSGKKEARHTEVAPLPGLQRRRTAAGGFLPVFFLAVSVQSVFDFGRYFRLYRLRREKKHRRRSAASDQSGTDGRLVSVDSLFYRILSAVCIGFRRNT